MDVNICLSIGVASNRPTHRLRATSIHYNFTQMTFFRLCRLVPAAFFLSIPVLAQDIEVKLTASDGASTDEFGRAVALDGDVALVGSPYDDQNGADSGSAYVFRQSGTAWLEEQKLIASDGTSNDFAGFAVALSGDVAIVGASGDADNGTESGSAYIFRFNGSMWVQEQKLVPSDGSAGDLFGRAVAVDGDLAIVGAPTDSDLGGERGSAYIFRWNGSVWEEEQKIAASDGAPKDLFGHSVSVSGDAAIVGAVHDNGISGGAYVFRFNGSTWQEEQRLAPHADGVFFGASVFIDADLTIVGSPQSNGAINTGSAYIFRFTGGTWVEEQRLVASDQAGFDFFGVSVSISDGTACIGANSENTAATNRGGAYFFRKIGGTWVEQRKLIASDGSNGDRFGAKVALSDEVVFVGAYYNDENGFHSGSAYVYSSITVVVEPTPGITQTLALDRPSPNPASRSTMVSFDLAGPETVALDIIDTRGRTVQTLRLGQLVAGSHTVPVDVSWLSPGSYLLRLMAGEAAPQSQRLTVVR